MTGAVGSVAELVAVAEESAPAEGVAVACAQAPGRVDVFGAVALVVAVGVEPVALAGVEFLEAVEAGLAGGCGCGCCCGCCCG